MDLGVPIAPVSHPSILGWAPLRGKNFSQYGNRAGRFSFPGLGFLGGVPFAAQVSASLQVFLPFDLAARKLDQAGIHAYCFGSTIMNWSKRVEDPFGNGFAAHGLNEDAFGEKTGIGSGLKTFDAFRECYSCI